MANDVVVMGESGSLSIRARAITVGAPAMEFSSGSFKGTVDERRVVHVVMAIPSTGKIFNLRFEFTDETFANVDLRGNMKRRSDAERPAPYTEPRAGRPLSEGR